MTEKSRKYLADILIAISLIEDFMLDIKDFHAYELDLKTQSAVERQLVIVGEALNKLKQGDAETLIENGHQIIAFRNRLVHAYDRIDNAIVWAIIKRHLDNLKLELSSLTYE